MSKQTIDTYPHCDCDGGWGPRVVLWFGDEPYEQVGWLEAGMWLYTEPGDPRCCGEFDIAPTHWMDIGDVWVCPSD